MITINSIVAKNFDIITADVSNPPFFNQFQPENLLLKRKILKIKELSIDAILTKLLTKDLCNKYSKILFNLEDKIEHNKVISLNLDHSLELVFVEDLDCYISCNSRGTPKTKADFLYNNYRYTNISVTDRKFFNINSKLHSNKAILLLSLGPEFYGYHYKFIATFFPLDPILNI